MKLWIYLGIVAGISISAMAACNYGVKHTQEQTKQKAIAAGFTPLQIKCMNNSGVNESGRAINCKGLTDD